MSLSDIIHRPIKFRAWDKKRKRMYKVLHCLYLDSIDGTWATVEGENIEQKKIHIQIQPKNIVLMQFIGLTDKFGKDIYEGDILGLENKKDKSKSVIVFEKAAFQRSYVPFLSEKRKKHEDYFEGDFIHHITHFDLTLWHVIGNIYQNAEIK